MRTFEIILETILLGEPNHYVQAGVVTHEEYDKITSMIMSMEKEMSSLGITLLDSVKQRYWDMKQGNLFNENQENGNTEPL